MSVSSEKDAWEAPLFCPNCRSEFRQGSYRCADCDVDLVHELPPEEKYEPSPEWDSDLVVVLDTENQPLLAATQSALQGAGIPFVVQGGTVSSLFPLRVLLLVSSVHADDAREIVAGFAEAPDVESSDDEASDDEPGW